MAGHGPSNLPLGTATVVNPTKIHSRYSNNKINIVMAADYTKMSYSNVGMQLHRLK